MKFQIKVGDVLDVLKAMPAESVHCVVTSPPYWGLRDYSICECAKRRNAGVDTLEEAGTVTDGVSGQYRPDDVRCQKEPSSSCEICHGTGEIPGVKDNQFGLELTPQLYIDKMVAVFRELRRVLRKDGTCWVNMGDSYSNDTKWGGQSGGKNYTSAEGNYRGQRVKRRDTDCDPKRGAMAIGQPISSNFSGLKPKDLVGMPWRLALALQADGWYLRSDIIWHKPNPMPESMTDRPTKSHEYIFLLSKSQRYFYDAFAIKEESTGNAHSRGGGVNPKSTKHGQHSRMEEDRDPRHIGVGRRRRARKGVPNQPRVKQNESFSSSITELVETRNKRSVWTVATQSYEEAHFATFPEELIQPCILAGTSEKGCCSDCGTPWERILEPGPEYKKALGSSYHDHSETAEKGMKQLRGKNGQNKARDEQGVTFADYRTVGWEPGCDCHGNGIVGHMPIVPATVLDPFAGSGTTGVVSLRYHRKFLGIELNPEYAAMARRRIKDDAPMFNVESLDNSQDSHSGPQQFLLDRSPCT